MICICIISLTTRNKIDRINKPKPAICSIFVLLSSSRMKLMNGKHNKPAI